MSNIIERHLEQNIEPTLSRQSYIDKAIEIFENMKEEDITTEIAFKHGNKYCLNGLFCRMTGFRDDSGFYDDAIKKLGEVEKSVLTGIHSEYTFCRDFEKMRQQAIDYMRSLK